MKDTYIRQANVLRIIDGDTLQVSIDLGFSITRVETVRLAKLNAPELRGESHFAGMAAMSWLSARVPPGSTVMLQTVKENDKYGRYLALLFVGAECINDSMVAAGQAKAVK